MENHVRRLHLERLSREDWIVIAVATALVLDLLVLPWFSFGATISVGSTTVSIGGSLTAVDAPDAWLGVLALLASGFLVADLAFERLSPQTRLLSLAESRETTRYVLACVASGLIALKFLLHLGRFGELALGFWLAVLLVGGLVALTRRARQAETAPGTTTAGARVATAGGSRVATATTARPRVATAGTPLASPAGAPVTTAAGARAVSAGGAPVTTAAGARAATIAGAPASAGAEPTGWAGPDSPVGPDSPG